jgi:hypothetical protein
MDRMGAQIRRSRNKDTDSLGSPTSAERHKNYTGLRHKNERCSPIRSNSIRPIVMGVLICPVRHCAQTAWLRYGRCARESWEKLRTPIVLSATGVFRARLQARPYSDSPPASSSNTATSCVLLTDARRDRHPHPAARSVTAHSSDPVAAATRLFEHCSVVESAYQYSA